MSRPATVSPDQIRTAVLTMLAEAGEFPDRQPPTGGRFRQVVSVRKLRARLGAGDPATLSRILNTVEAEVVRAGLADVAMPGLPDTIAAQMRALWQSAVSVQLDEVMRLKADAVQATEAADVARRDADLRDQISVRDTALATVREEFRAASGKMAEVEATVSDLRTTLASANTMLVTANSEHAAAIATVHTRYEGLSKQLLQETAHQRDAFRTERERLTGEVAKAVERAAALEGLRDRLLAELASERDAHQRAAAEARALTTVIAEQRALLQAGHAVQTNARRPARPTAGPTRHRQNPDASTPAISSPVPAGSTARRKAR